MRTSSLSACILGWYIFWDGTASALDLSLSFFFFLPIPTIAGAKKVIAIECSGIVEQAQQIMDSNPLYGKKVEIIQAKCEDLDELPDGITEV